VRLRLVSCPDHAPLIGTLTKPRASEIGPMTKPRASEIVGQRVRGTLAGGKARQRVCDSAGRVLRGGEQGVPGHRAPGR